MYDQTRNPEQYQKASLFLMQWQREQVLAFAPDSASIKVAQKLTTISKWSAPGVVDGVALWGECRGGREKPYQTAIDLAEIAFKCSCPSRKFPCKHALALFLLYVETTDSFVEQEPMPNWVQRWLDGRAKRRNAQTESALETAPNLLKSTPAQLEKKTTPYTSTKGQSSVKTQERRAAARAEKVASGVDELTIWLKDLVRSGFIDAQTRPYSYWQQMAARLIDAQAPGLAAQVTALGNIAASGDGWADQLTAALGKLFLLLKAYQRLETLPVPLQREVRTLIGWHQTKEEVLAGEAVAGHWRVLSHTLEQEENLISQRIWLQEIDRGQYALILNFAHPSNRQSLDAFWRSGTEVEATLFYYAGALPLRALATDVVTKTSLTSVAHLLPIAEALHSYQQGVAQNPWLTRYPFFLANVIPGAAQQRSAPQGFIYDQTQHLLPLSRKAKSIWQLLSITGAHPAHLFGEWLDDGLLPLGLWYEGRYWAL